jgi:hypothetical protein
MADTLRTLCRAISGGRSSGHRLPRAHRAAQAVARSPDRYTVLMAAFTHAVNVSLHRSIGYDPVADCQPVTLLSYQRYVKWASVIRDANLRLDG